MRGAEVGGPMLAGGFALPVSALGGAPGGCRRELRTAGPLAAGRGFSAPESACTPALLEAASDDGEGAGAGRRHAKLPVA
jgi:hypothetical protein